MILSSPIYRLEVMTENERLVCFNLPMDTVLLEPCVDLSSSFMIAWNVPFNCLGLLSDVESDGVVWKD